MSTYDLERVDDDEDVDADDDRVEQLGPDDPDPKGQHRELEGRGTFPWLYSYSSATVSDDVVQTEAAYAPKNLDTYWNKYYKGFPLTRAPLKLFDEIVVEPGYRIRCELGEGERDEEMETALKEWAANCVIHAAETGEDLSVLLSNIPSQRRGKGTVFVEKVGTESDPDALARLMMLKPSTMKILKRRNQPLLVHPDDPVDPNDKRSAVTEDGEAAAYVQYHDDLGYDKDPITFTKDEIIKITYDADTGDAWGTSIFEALADRIDSLIQKLEDRDMSIRMAGYPHRIYSSEGWTEDEARQYARAHKKGELSAHTTPDRDEDPKSFAGRVDFVPEGTVNVQVESGNVPDLADAIMDDVQQIFSLMPVSRFKIAYEEDINQFVVEPQQDKDDLVVDSERRYLERKFEPVFEEKADELAGGSYDGEVHFSIESPKEENPLKREGFPAENLQALMTALKDYKDGNVEQDIPIGALAEWIGFDIEAILDQHGWDPDPLELDDEDDTAERLDELEAMIEGEEGDEDDDDDGTDQDDGDRDDNGDDEGNS